jgi:RHS repeat-associated protein
VLVLSLNGAPTAPDTTTLRNAGFTVTQVTPSQWASEPASYFESFAALVIGDPSIGSCSSLLPVTGTAGSGQVSIGTSWQAAVTGNVAVAGTAPELAATAGAKALVADSAGYAAAAFTTVPGGTQGTGLYVSLDCEYSGSAAGADVSFLDGVEGIGAAGSLTVNGGLSCADAGTVNAWEADNAGTFSGFTSASLGTGTGGFPPPSCPVQEAFDSWPGNFTPAGYDSSAATVNFTASNGGTGQPYILLGTEPLSMQTGSGQYGAQSLALSPTTGGEVPALTTVGGLNAAAGGLDQATDGNGVNTENGDLTQASTDVSVPTFGPSLDFTRTYDSQQAQQQELTGTPGVMGYGWTDNWASSLTASAPIPGDIYALDGLAGASGTGEGLTAYAADGQAPASAPLGLPGGVLISNGNVYYSDTGGNRVEEVAGSTGTQWGISMTASDTYTIAGSSTGGQGSSGDTFKGYNALLSSPMGLAMDSAGNLYIADNGNYRVQELSAAGGTQWGQSMLAGHIYDVAGDGGLGDSGDGGSATRAQLGVVTCVAADPAGDLYIADAGDNQIQEVAAATGSQWGQQMTANDIYTVAGSAAGTAGRSANGTAGGSSLLNDPQGITVDSAGDMYIADTGNNRVIEIPGSSGSSWGYSMNAGDVYDVAGSAAGTAGHTGDGSGAYATALLDAPAELTLDGSGDMIIADTGNNRAQFVPRSAGTVWGQSMSAGDMYTIAGSSSGTAGNSGNGGTGTSALLHGPGYLALDGPGNVYIADTGNDQVRKLTKATNDISRYAGNGQSLASSGNGGPAINGELVRPGGEIADPAGDLYIADTANNRIQEVAAATRTQWGIHMTGGDVYTIAGSPAGQPGNSGDGGPATAALLNYPEGLAFDAAGDLLVVDQFNNQVRKISAATGTISTIAGSAAGTAGAGSDGVPATSGLLDHPFGLAVDAKGDIYIADKVNSRIQEIYAAGGYSWGQSMTAGDIYTVAGNATGVSGSSGDGGPATSALLNGAEGIAAGPSGNLYIADTANNRIQEVPAATGTQWNRKLTRNDIYTIAGSPAGTAGGAGGMSGNAIPAAQSLLHTPVGLATDGAADLYIADGDNNRVEEIAAQNGTQWGDQMTAGDIYTIAGKSGTPSDTGNGGPAAMATIFFAMGNSTDSYGDLYISDWSSGQLREVTSATPATITPAPGLASALYPPPGATINGTTYPGGITITQPGGARITFYPQGSGGTCTAPQVTAGQYCVMPLFQGATLTGNGTSYTFSPSPGSGTYTYSWAGQLTAQTDTAGDTLTVTYLSPAPGSSTTGTSTPVLCPATATSCNTVTSASGRALVIGADASGHVTTVTDPLGRTWTYGYTGSDLTTAKDPMGNTTSYTYDTSNASQLLTADLLTTTGPNAQPGGPDAGKSTTSTYNAAGQVTSQTDPMGNKTTFSYCASPATRDCLNPATGTGYVTVTDPDANTTVYDYQSGTLAALSSWTGGTALTSETDNLPDTAVTASSSTCPDSAASDGGLLNTATFDGDGNQTSYCYDSAGDAITTTSPSGGSTPSGLATTSAGYTTAAQNDEQTCEGIPVAPPTNDCNQNAGPAAVPQGQAISPPSSAPPAGLTWSLYDTDGNELYSTTGVYQPGATTASYTQTTYQLFNGNTVTLPGTSTQISCTHTAPSPSLPCATIDADGVVTQLEYNQQGDLIQSFAPDGNGSQLATTTHSYDADGEPTSTISPDGNLPGANAGNYTTTVAYNADGEQSSATQAGGVGATVTPRTTSYGYDGDGNQTTVTDARSYPTTTEFNADDQPTLVTNPDGDATLTCYDGDGKVTQTVPPVGVAANNLTPASCPTSYPADYNPANSPPLAADATMSAYDADGNQTAVYSPAPAGLSGYETTTYAYDGADNLITTTGPPVSNTQGAPGQVTVDTYNTAGLLTSETTGYGTPAASTVSYCYDPSGDTTSVVYADGNTSVTYMNGTVYGLAGCSTSSPWTVSATPQVNYQTTYSYDSAANVVSATTPETAAAPNGGTTTSTYDPAGNMLTSTDPGGVTTTRTYTPSGQSATITYSGSSAHAVSYNYDADGNTTAMTDATGSSTYAHDPFGELTSATKGAGQMVSYGYDADGNTTAITYPLPPTATWPTSDTVSYGYDKADTMTSITDFNGHQITITPDANGGTASEAPGATGDTISNTYSAAGPLSKIALKSSTSTLQSFAYSDAPSRNTLTETDTPSSPTSPAAYTYDTGGRVTSMTSGSDSPLTYTFDASGNLTTLPTGAAATYDHAGELNSSGLNGTTTGYTYNASGERLTATQNSQTIASGTWNGAAELTVYANSAASMTSATYDGNGLRASATSTPSGGSASTQSFVWNTAPATGTPQLLMDSGNAYIWGQGLAPAEQVNLTTGAVSYLISDVSGSVRGTVSSTGALTATTSYDAWGNSQTPGGLTASTPFGFAGGYTDATGLIYLINRYYDPVTGQFLSVDPAASQTLQPYAYASGNPVTQGDPDGLMPQPPPPPTGYSYPPSSPYYIPPLEINGRAHNPWETKFGGRPYWIPLRNGDHKFGWNHLCCNSGHGIWNPFLIGMAITHGQTTACPATYGPACKRKTVVLYNTHLYENGEGSLWLANFRDIIQLGLKRDGFPKGVTNAWCPGQANKGDCAYNGRTFWVNTAGTVGVYRPGYSRHIGYIGPAADYPPPI